MIERISLRLSEYLYIANIIAYDDIEVAGTCIDGYTDVEAKLAAHSPEELYLSNAMKEDRAIPTHPETGERTPYGPEIIEQGNSIPWNTK